MNAPADSATTGPPKSDETKALFECPKKGMVFFEKWDQLTSQILFIAVGIFAVMPAAIATLRKPYRVGSMVWLIVIVGIIAVYAAAHLKLHLNGYFRRLALLSAGGSVENNEKQIEQNSWRLLKVAGISALIEVIAFIGFIALNIQTTLQEPPRVTSVQASQTVVEPGTTITIQATASDRDDDLLTYTWTSPKNGTQDGTLVAKDLPTATWVAPKMIGSSEEQFPISVVVNDGHEPVKKDIVIIVREPPEIQAGIQRLCLMEETIENAEGGDNDSASNKKVSATQPLASSSFVRANFQSNAAQAASSVEANCPRIEGFIRTGAVSTAEEKARIDFLETSLKDRFLSSLKKLFGIGKKSKKELPCCSSSLNPFVRCRPC